MRLFHLQNGEFHLRQFNKPANRPKYAILSHRWREGEEVLFEDVKDSSVSLDGALKGGWYKIQNCKHLVTHEDDVDAFWIDTCCINKDSSAELQEAINSMYAWYRDAKVCYAYLDDVDASSSTMAAETGSKIRASEWFTRCWTLQELIAPRKVVFFDRTWQRLGTRDDMVDLMSSITTIPKNLLLGEARLSDFSVAQRMSWAACRHASRVEDESYSLLGLFGTSLPMLYGEGSRAFIRLQEEIIRNSADQSILAWQHAGEGWRHAGEGVLGSRTDTILAQSVSNFASCSDVVPTTNSAPLPFRLTNIGLEIQLQVFELEDPSRYGAPLDERFQNQEISGKFALLQCRSTVDPTQAFTLPLAFNFDKPAPGIDQETYLVRYDGRSEKSRVRRLSFEELPRHRLLTPLVLRERHLDFYETIWIRLHGSKLKLSNAYPQDVSIHEPRPTRKILSGWAGSCVDVQIGAERIGIPNRSSGVLELRYQADFFVLHVMRDRYTDYVAVEQGTKSNQSLQNAHRDFLQAVLSCRGVENSRLYHFLTSTLTGRRLLISSSRLDVLRMHIAYDVYVSGTHWPRMTSLLLGILRQPEAVYGHSSVIGLPFAVCLSRFVHPLTEIVNRCIVKMPSYLLDHDSQFYETGNKIARATFFPMLLIAASLGIWHERIEEYLLGRPLRLSSELLYLLAFWSSLRLARILDRVIAILLWLLGSQGGLLRSLLLANPPGTASSYSRTRRFCVIELKDVRTADDVHVDK